MMGVGRRRFIQGGQGLLAGRLFFAGEATSRQHFGTAHGAYLSGLAVAQQIRQGAA